MKTVTLSWWGRIDSEAKRFTFSYAISLLRLKYRYTALGFFWNFLEPALFLAVLSVVFSVVNKMDIADYAVFLFAALIPWRYFEKVVNGCMDSIVGGEWLLKKVAVSPATLPLARWIVASAEFFFSLLIVFLFLVFLKRPWTAHLIILPLSILPWSMFGLGAGLAAAVAFTFFRDVRPIVQMLIMLVFFSSPILFKPDMFDQGSIQSLIIRFHPMTYFSALFQKPIYFGVWPDSIDWVVSWSVSLLTLGVGWLAIHRFKDRFYYYL